jgi:maltose O-acetyltransferase
MAETPDQDQAGLASLPGYRWARKLPNPIKRLLLACHWWLKAFVEDWQDYTAELVGYVPSHALRLWWYRHICRITIGRHSSIHRRCRMYHPYRIVIGDHSVVNYGVLLDGRCGLRVGNNVSLSEGTAIFTLAHDIDDTGFVQKGAPVVVEDRVFVGACARILPGVTLGEGAVVAAGAVVTRDAAPYTVVAGVPARYIRHRPRELDYQLDHRKRFG